MQRVRAALPQHAMLGTETPPATPCTQPIPRGRQAPRPVTRCCCVSADGRPCPAAAHSDHRQECRCMGQPGRANETDPRSRLASGDTSNPPYNTYSGSCDVKSTSQRRKQNWGTWGGGVDKRHTNRPTTGSDHRLDGTGGGLGRPAAWAGDTDPRARPTASRRDTCMFALHCA